MLIAASLLLLTAAGCIVARYHDPSARYRFMVSMIAACFAGSCFAGVAWVIATREASPTLLVVALVAFLLALATRGNLGKIFPSFKSDHWRSEP
ncbi:hypothetical protein D3C78_412330 [compost metagenome]